MEESQKFFLVHLLFIEHARDARFCTFMKKEELNENLLNIEYSMTKMTSIINNFALFFPTAVEMATVRGEEESPLLTKEEKGEKRMEEPPSVGGWTAEGLPLVDGSVVGEPVVRSQWNSSLFACLGRNDEFCSSDLEVCLLGSFVPCMLYGSNVERIGSGPGTYANHCLAYTGLYLLGSSLLGSNYLAPWFSYHSRTAIRRKFNLEGSCEAFTRSCGCCHGIIEVDEQRERCESACDFATHFFCHACSLCQEGRELRRRVPHPGFAGRSVLVMIPPGEQTMGRGL